MQQQANDSEATTAVPEAAAPAASKAAPGAAPAGAANRGRGGSRGGQGQTIIYDCDFGRDIDTILALAVLNNLGAKGRLAAIGVSNSSLEAASFCDALGKFYAGESTSPFGGRGGGGLIVGLAETGPKLNASPMIDGPLAMKNPEGKPLFRHGINEFNDTADAPVVFRNALTAQKDGETTVILAGPATDLVHLLAVNGGSKFVASKVGLLIVAAGSYPEGPADPRILADLESARQLFATWPTPIVAVGTEVGTAIPYPAESIEKDFSWTPAHPVVEAYRANRPIPYDAPAQAVIAALYAANQSEEYFHLSGPGTITVADDGRTTFVPSPGGKHRYLMPDLAQKDKITKAFTALASAKPAAPQGRGGRGAFAAPAGDPAAPQKKSQ